MKTIYGRVTSYTPDTKVLIVTDAANYTWVSAYSSPFNVGDYVEVVYDDERADRKFEKVRVVNESTKAPDRAKYPGPWKGPKPMTAPYEYPQNDADREAERQIVEKKDTEKRVREAQGLGPSHGQTLPNKPTGPMPQPGVGAEKTAPAKAKEEYVAAREADASNARDNQLHPKPPKHKDGG